MINFENFLNRPIAHRGLHSKTVDENSISAFKLAIDNNYGIEIDVRLLKDGTVAIHHDSNLKRVCGADIKISSLTADDLKKYPMTISGETIPTFPQLLELVNGQIPILVELKTATGAFSNKLAKAVIRDLQYYKHKNTIALQSFDPFTVRWLRKNAPEYPYGQLATMGGLKKPNILFKFMGHLKCCSISKPQFIAYDILNIPNDYLIGYANKSYPIITWTVDTKEKLETARKYANNIIFEDINPD